MIIYLFVSRGALLFVGGVTFVHVLIELVRLNIHRSIVFN